MIFKVTHFEKPINLIRDQIALKTSEFNVKQGLSISNLNLAWEWPIYLTGTSGHIGTNHSRLSTDTAAVGLASNAGNEMLHCGYFVGTTE
jgi:hypothetical protein